MCEKWIRWSFRWRKHKKIEKSLTFYNVPKDSLLKSSVDPESLIYIVTSRCVTHAECISDEKKKTSTSLKIDIKKTNSGDELRDEKFNKLMGMWSVTEWCQKMPFTVYHLTNNFSKKSKTRIEVL